MPAMGATSPGMCSSFCAMASPPLGGPIEHRKVAGHIDLDQKITRLCGQCPGRRHTRLTPISFGRVEMIASNFCSSTLSNCNSNLRSASSSTTRSWLRKRLIFSRATNSSICRFPSCRLNAHRLERTDQTPTPREDHFDIGCARLESFLTKDRARALKAGTCPNPVPISCAVADPARAIEA
jgi:hypothetical protein